MKRYFNISIDSDGSFKGEYSDGSRPPVNFISTFTLHIIHSAWNAGIDFEDLADGYGKGRGTNGDWSGIRDSSGEAISAMLERALNRMTFQK